MEIFGVYNPVARSIPRNENSSENVLARNNKYRIAIPNV